MYASWIAGFTYSGGCSNATATDLTQYEIPEAGQLLVINYIVSDNCQSVSCTASFLVNPCAFCTYTQGYYGNTNGSACTPDGVTSNAQAIMTQALTNVGGIVNFGSTITGNYFRLTLADITSGNIFKMLPGGGTPRALIGYATYSVNSTWSDNDPLRASGPNKGRINNNLLSQTMTLFFNTQLNPTINNLQLTSTFTTADTGTCGSHIPVVGTEQTFNIPTQVISYLNANGGATVGNLLILANRALGGQSIMGVTPSQVNQAVDAINRGFDECRVLVSNPQTVIANSVENLTAKINIANTVDVEVYPVPFKEVLTLNYKFETSSPVTIDVFDIRGVLLSSQTDTNVFINKELPLKLNFAILQSQVFFIKVTSDKGTVVKKVISKQ